jgi:circadian clock protein KaiB
MQPSKRTPEEPTDLEVRGPRFVLKLYVTGLSLNSKRAVANITRICDTYLPGRHDLQIIDLFQQPELAQGKQIIAAPTLVKEQPLPSKRIVGDLSDERRLLHSLDLEVKA